MMNTKSIQYTGEAESRGSSQAWASSPPKSILIVEDEASIRRLLVSLLSSQGYRIESVANGSLALRILEDDPRIDLVLTDLAMPGIPGTAVAEYLAHTRPDIKVVCMSGDPQPHMKSLRRLLDRRLVDFLPKPFTPLQVLQMVKRLLER
ncbi:MAG TPA: response regulator [Fibrobacteria bacterium]|nr:response regulator [Fibrobacteria bacterium]